MRSRRAGNRGLHMLAEVPVNLGVENIVNNGEFSVEVE